MRKFIFQPLLFVTLITLCSNALCEGMIYKCKNPQGTTIYKKAPCDVNFDTVSTWTPKETKQPVPSTSADESKDKKDNVATLTLKQNAGGHYITEGNVDSTPLIFVVDTGASHISLPESVAHDAQIYCDKNIKMATANGNSSGCTAKAKKVQFGPFIVEQVEVILAPNLTQPLLGMNVLQLFSISQESGVMKISVKDKNTTKDKVEEKAKEQ
jgi:clan AA aspartic protease (TIGR02281 family)